MAKVKLELEANLDVVETAFEKGEQIIAESGVTIQKFGKEAKDAYMKAFTEAHKYNTEVDVATKQTKTLSKELGNLAKTKSAVQQLKAEIKFYTSEALKAGEGTKAFVENLTKAGKLKDQLEDLNKQVTSLNGNIGENFARAAGNSINLVSRGYEGLIAVQTLAGDKSREFEETIAKLQSLNAIANIAREFGGIKDTLTEIKLGFAPVIGLYTKGNEGLKTFYKNLREGKKDVAGSKGLFENLGTGIKSFVSSGISGIKSLWATIRANPLGIILVVLGGVITALVTLKDRVKFIADAFEVLGDVINAIIFPFEKLAQAIGLVASENEKRLKESIKGSKEYLALIKEEYDFIIALAEVQGKRTQEIEKRGLQFRKEVIKDRLADLAELQKINKKLSKEELDTAKELSAELIKVQDELTLAIAKEQEERKDFARESANTQRDISIALIKDDEKREIAQAEKRRDDALEKLAETTLGIFNENEAFEAGSKEAIKINELRDKEIAEIRKKFADKRKEENDKLLSLEKDFQAALLDIGKRIEANKILLLSGEERIEAETQMAREELAILKQNLIAKGQAEEDYAAKIQNRKAEKFKLTIDQQQQFDILEAQLFEQQTQKLIALEVERQNAIMRAKSAAAKQTLATLDTQESADILAVQGTPRPEGLEVGSRQEIQFEEQKQIAILNIQKSYADKKLELKKASLEAERAELLKGYNGELEIVGNGEDAETQKKREEIIKRVGLTEQQFIAQQAELDAGYAAELAGIDEQLAKLNAKKPFNLAALLGLKDSELANIQNAMSSIQSVFDSILDGVIAEKDEQIRISEEKRNSYIKDIEELESKVQTEDELNERGKANNKARILQEIEDKKRLAAKEIELQQKALEEKKKAQKQKLLIDSITQASNLAVAATEILAATAGGGPVGVAIGVITIAAMFAAFAAAKVQALKAIESQKVTEGEQGFKDGVIDLKGPGTETSDSIKANLSRGESVMTAKETREYKPLFKAIRYNNKALIDRELMNLLDGTGVTLPKNLPSLLAAKKNQVREGELKVYVNNNYNDLKKEQEITNKKLAELIMANKNKTYKNQNGDLIEQIGSHKIITRK